MVPGESSLVEGSTRQTWRLPGRAANSRGESHRASRSFRPLSLVAFSTARPHGPHFRFRSGVLAASGVGRGLGYLAEGATFPRLVGSCEPARPASAERVAAPGGCGGFHPRAPLRPQGVKATLEA